MRPDDDLVAQQIANLRLEVAALTQTAKAASLPEAVAKVRATVTLSAVLITVALLLSAFFGSNDATRSRRLEKRLEQLEKRVERVEHALPPAPGM